MTSTLTTAWSARPRRGVTGELVAEVGESAGGDAVSPRKVLQLQPDVASCPRHAVQGRHAYTFRKAVATLIAEASDSKAAARQLGHSREGITKRHYIASPEQTPDSSAVLEQGFGMATG